MNESWTQEASGEFGQCWAAAGRHLETHALGCRWLKRDLWPPFLEHISFELGNQAFFIRVEDVDGILDVPGDREGLFAVAEGCNGHPCILPMRRHGVEWVAHNSGWGLVNAQTGAPVDPPALVTDEPVVMTDWEMQDFAVQLVSEVLQREGRRLMSRQGNPVVNPSIWLEGESGPEWVIVRAVRFPQPDATPPNNLPEIAKYCARLGTVGHFASVGVASAYDAFDPSGQVPAFPLLRGYPLVVRYRGLETLPPFGVSLN